MEDPERLLSATSEADLLEREVLTSLRNVTAPPGVREAAWRGVAAGIAVTSVAVASQTTAAAMSPAASGANAALSIGVKGAPAGFAKYALLAALGTAAVGGGAYWAHRRSLAKPLSAAQPPLAVAPSAARAVPPPTIAASPANVAVPSSPVRVGNDVTSAPARSVSRRTDTELLAAESALLASARSALRAGKIPAAQRELIRLRARFPHGALVQERDVLGIELLSARGDSAGARRAARAFVASYPDSPHSTQLRSLLAAP